MLHSLDLRLRFASMPDDDSCVPQEFSVTQAASFTRATGLAIPHCWEYHDTQRESIRTSAYQLASFEEVHSLVLVSDQLSNANSLGS